jgi:type I restriction enzyme M protein
MGLVFEELIRRFAEASNETAGEHFTPRDIVRLTTSLLFIGDDTTLTKAGIVRSLYDPTAGTGGFLSSGSEYVYEMNPDAKLVTFGQELNPESYAICKADMLIKGQAVENIKYGNTLSDDQLYDKQFDYMLSNPPFGVEWKKVEKEVKKEYLEKGFGGRFGPGLPRVSDGSLLFLLHLISKMRPKEEGGSRIGIILNGSPLFTGSAGSGESEIRRYILESDLLEGIVAMPTDMFFNTGISTYIWILSNHKAPERKGKVQLVNASGFGESMRKSLGSKRKQLSDGSIDEIARAYGIFIESKICKIFDTTDFGYRRITVERPLIEDGKVTMSKGKPKPDTALRDNENIPLKEDIHEYFKREVLPHVPDAWISEDKKHIDAKDGKLGIVGYEIPFNRHFYEYTPPRSLSEIDMELDSITKEILDLLNEVHS